jgi:hypothetical protein
MADTPTPPADILPNDPNHRHYPLYQHVLRNLNTLEPGRTAEQRSNLAAGLTDAYLDSLPQNQRNLRLDETTIRDLQVVKGAANAPTPSLFLTSASQAQNDSAPRISTPLATANVPAATTLAAHTQQRTVGADGFLTDQNITQTRIAALEGGNLNAVNGIVLHRTAGSTAAGTLGHWRGQANPNGTHFLIDRDGTIHQTASLNQTTSHIGRIRSRGEEEGTLTPEERTQLANTRAAPGNDFQAVHRLESGKPYPQRYPTNGDSVGIEVVATYNETTKRWQDPSPQQVESIRRLVGILQTNYGLNDRDIYEHDKISYKAQGEGAGLYQPQPNPPAHGVQQPAGPQR